MTEATTPNPNDAPADTPAAVEDSALAAAAKTDAPANDEPEAKVEAPVVVEGAPEAYDTAAFTMPEGVEFDADGFKEVEPVLRELNLNQDQAGKLMAAYGEKIVPLIAKRTTDAFDEQAAELRANLARDLQADPEVGGKKLDESKAMAAKAIAHFIPKADERSEFSTFLNESGLGNQRHLMRIIAGAGRVLSEATTLASETATAPKSNAEVFYGKKG